MRKFLSLFLLIIVINSIFQLNNLNFMFKNQDISELNEFQNETPYFDVEREIQPLEDIYPEYSPDHFSMSPLNVNDYSNIKSTVKSEEASLIINIDLEKQVLTSNEDLNYVIQVTKGLQPVSGETYILDIIKGQYWGWYFYWLEDYSTYEDRIIETKPIITNSNGEYQGQFKPPGKGQYSIIIRSSLAYIQESRSFTVADIGLFWRVSREFAPGEPHYSVAYVLNTTDFSPVSSADVTLTGVTYEYQAGDYQIQTIELFTDASNEQGIVEIDFTPPSAISGNYHFLANLSVTYNGESVYVSRDIYRGGYYYWDWNSYSEFQHYEFIVTTDKPIYSPGETIHTRILLWENDYLKVTKEPIETSFILKILSPSQHTLIYKELKTNSYGVAEFSFSLDTESELGSYHIVTQKAENLASVEVRVDKYEKPSFRVKIALDSEYVPPGKVVSGNIMAEYYFGKPVINGEVELAIGNFDVITGTTDSNGYWEFRYRLPGESSFEDINAIPINCTVIDTVGRQVTSSVSIQISKEIYTWAYINPWFPKVGENVTIYFGAYQYSGWDWRSWSPLVEADVEIKLFAMTGGFINPYIETFSSKTDFNGRGQVEYEIPTKTLRYYSRFKGVIEVDAGDGRKGTSTFYFTVDRNLVETTLSANNFKSGDTIELEVAIKNAVYDIAIEGNVRIRIFDADFDQIGEEIKHIPTSGSLIDFKLSSYAPTGKYLVYFYLETSFDNEWGFWTYYRHSTTIEFQVGSSHKISLETNQSSYSLTDSLILTGSLQGNTNAPIMVQFVKKGIVVTEYISANSGSDFNIYIADIGFLAPRFWIYAFAILEDGSILDTYLSLDIDTTILIEISSNKEVYEPAESAEIEIKVYDSKQRPISAVLAVSFIDSSVFGVQSDFESENEHFNEYEYWPSVWTVSSWKSRQNDWWFWWYDDIRFGGNFYYGMEEDAFITYDAPEQMSAREKSDNNQDLGLKSQKIRDFLPENAYWSPQVIIENGYLKIDLTLPDTIGEWTVRVVATTSSGFGILSKFSFKTFLPFFVEIDKEPFVMQDDVFVLKGVVYNYLNELVDIDLEIKTETGLLLLGHSKQKLRIPSGFLGSVGWACLAQDAGFFNITFYAGTSLENGTKYQDAIRKSLEVIPNGVPLISKTSGFISSNPAFSYVQHSETIQEKEFLELSLGLGSIALNSWDRLIRYPYGCTEQTISRLIPDVLILEYLKQTGQLTNETEELIMDMITSGLSRLYTQRHSDGGWGWWQSDESRVYMTSLVLYGLGIINKTGIHIESSIIQDALDMLVGYQNIDGSWDIDSWRNIDKASFTAFVLRSILLWKDFSWLSASIAEAINYITVSWNDITTRSTYLAGLYLDSVPASGFGFTSFETTLLTYLRNEVQLSSEGYYWSYATEEKYWWRALGGDIEITALALKALVLDDPTGSMPIIRGAVQWLLQQQSWYGWGNTADTAAAISTIISINQNEISSNEDAEVTLTINDQIVGKYNLSMSNQPIFYLNLEDLLVEGLNNFSLLKNGNGNVSYYFYGEQILRNLPRINIPDEITALPGQEVELSIDLAPNSVEIFASDLIIHPLSGEITPNINLSQTITLLTQQTSIAFSYLSPSKIGTYEISGVEISYKLSDYEQEHFSPGIITRRYGPIKLEVVESNEGVLLQLPSSPNLSMKTNNEKSFSITSSSSKLLLAREYTKKEGFVKGDFVLVTLTITNNKQTENFIMLEDFVPVGFELDESTIQHPARTYQVTPNGITFFFPELDIGEMKVAYGLIAVNVRQSIVFPARLSSMYDDWVVTSTSEILGGMRVPIDPKTGTIILDLQAPRLEKLVIKELFQGSRAGVHVTIDAIDNWKIASVRIFIKQSTWNVFECSEDNNGWKILAMGLSEGKTQFYVEIIDYAGNVMVSEPSIRYLELQDLIIPVIPILGLMIVAILAGTCANVIIKKKQK
ncbi:MAG: MG2 domain-containing protein [Candidatus Hodarchaeota archaeon]